MSPCTFIWPPFIEVSAQADLETQRIRLLSFIHKKKLMLESSRLFQGECCTFWSVSEVPPFFESFEHSCHQKRVRLMKAYLLQKRKRKHHPSLKWLRWYALEFQWPKCHRSPRLWSLSLSSSMRLCKVQICWSRYIHSSGSSCIYPQASILLEESKCKLWCGRVVRSWNSKLSDVSYHGWSLNRDGRKTFFSYLWLLW